MDLYPSPDIFVRYMYVRAGHHSPRLIPRTSFIVFIRKIVLNKYLSVQLNYVNAATNILQDDRN